jgi:hypothetical protein
MKKYFLILLLSLLCFAGCSQEKKQEKKNPLHETIVIYNGLLADGYRRQDMNHLIQAATPQRALKAYYHMAAIGEGGVKMDSVLKKIEFTGHKELAADKAQILTKEVWDYRYISNVTGDKSPLRTINYTVRYTLEKNEAKWLVANATILYGDRKSDAADLDFFKRPQEILQGSVPSKKKTGINKADEDIISGNK